MMMMIIISPLGQAPLGQLGGAQYAMHSHQLYGQQTILLAGVQRARAGIAEKDVNMI
jgi:hypothetical protein